ncbi:putative ABC transport system permease protein [Paenibacillus taihuensis]|uniref:Putative ABC transport system permease protein n=1 Tax=Paenibacillus taihuensis TaxID=1156355 RepID=A0A3D9SCH6_9BACL|nr:iron export ABC transporter permease subunit FetB [Paenibacillus taihuensis]REE91604.1 putative ABC transport system permease protein [Paenibacillus taihuensis]
MTLFTLSFTLLFVFATMMISYWQKLGLEKEIAIGTIRSAVQLLLIGYVLQYVFQTENYVILVVIICVMIGVASWNAAKRGGGMHGVVWRIAISISVMEVLMMGMLLGLHLIKATPQYIIPLSGMTIGNAMVVAGLFMNQLKREAVSSRGEIEALLSLGASAQQALHQVRKRIVKFSMIPTIDGMKTVGLVQLPGMMTGMIVAGASPVEAVRYQILIVFSFTGSAAITSILLSVLCYKLVFTKDLQVVVFQDS